MDLISDGPWTSISRSEQNCSTTQAYEQLIQDAVMQDVMNDAVITDN